MDSWNDGPAHTLIVGAGIATVFHRAYYSCIIPCSGGSLWIILWTSLKSVGKTSSLSKMPKL
jgi:hypothetical protein